MADYLHRLIGRATGDRTAAAALRHRALPPRDGGVMDPFDAPPVPFDASPAPAGAPRAAIDRAPPAIAPRSMPAATSTIVERTIVAPSESSAPAAVMPASRGDDRRAVPAPAPIEPTAPLAAPVPPAAPLEHADRFFGRWTNPPATIEPPPPAPRRDEPPPAHAPAIIERTTVERVVTPTLEPRTPAPPPAPAVATPPAPPAPPPLAPTPAMRTEAPPRVAAMVEPVAAPARPSLPPPPPILSIGRVVVEVLPAPPPTPRATVIVHAPAAATPSPSVLHRGFGLGQS